MTLIIVSAQNELYNATAMSNIDDRQDSAVTQYGVMSSADETKPYIGTGCTFNEAQK